jgi:amino acid adenylation domain-containing protein/thioester reductase-like protein
MELKTMSDLPITATGGGATGAFAAGLAVSRVHRAVGLLIEDQAARTPDRPAIAYRDTVLDYREVVGLVRALAAELSAAGVRRGDLVPVDLVNSLELPICLLALHRLGAAFVLCDPAWPADRMKAALAAIEPDLLLGTDHPGAAGVPVRPVALDRIVPALEGPCVEPGPDEPAYGVFTSGTSGTPKCAINLHRGLANRFAFMTRYFAADGGEVVLQNSRHTFDSAIWQLLWPLTTGGRTVIPDQGDFLDLERTVATIAAHRVTLTDFVPATLGTLVALVEADPAALEAIRSLRDLVVGGEEVGPSAVHRLRALLPGLRVSNGYGPSETSIGMVFHPITAEDGDHVPLGRPIDNCHVVLTDEALNPVAPGEIGEIVVGGACVGAGYHLEPELTAKAFVDNPFPGIPGPRLYRTGDLGWFDEHELLHFSGRIDRQVKVNGMRIELAEVEAAAAGCPGVSHAKALTVRGNGGGTRLAVAVVGAAEADAVHAHLAGKLPRPSLPQHVLVLPALPLTDNGKVDLRALQAAVESGLRAPAGPAEGPEQRVSASPAETVAAIMAEVLERAEFGIDDDFTSRGGDSLRAMTAVLRLRAAFGAAVGVQDLYEQRTPARLAALIARAGATGSEESDESLMERDAQLPPEMVSAPLGALKSGEVRTVLVTGATGFVGSRVVLQLLRDTDMHVICLVRGDGEGAARERLVDVLRKIGADMEAAQTRLTVHAADLDRARLGLDEHVWNELASECDAVLHVGALVNLLFDYRAHRGANVLGTRELIRFCRTARTKPLHHVSTLGALDRHAAAQQADGGEPVEEGCDPAAVLPPLGGYSRSKWVAERLVLEAARRGAPASVYRLGEVMPAADNGLPNPRALTHLLLTAFHRLGMVPAVPMLTDYTPVDQVADRLVAGLGDGVPAARALHVFHGESLDLPALAPGLPAVPEEVFRAALPGLGREFEVLLSLPASGLERVLTDNPALFRRVECMDFDRRHGLGDRPLTDSIAAYRRHIRRVSPVRLPE